MKYQTRQNDYYNVSLQPVWKMCVGHVGGTRHRRSRIIPYMSVLVNDDNIPNQTKQLLHCITTTSREMCVGHIGGTRDTGVYCTTCQFCGMSTTYQTRLDNYSYYTVSMRPVWKICVGHVRGTRWWDTKHNKNHDNEHVHHMYHHDSDWQIDFMIQCVHYV